MVGLAEFSITITIITIVITIITGRRTVKLHYFSNCYSRKIFWHNWNISEYHYDPKGLE